MKHRDIDIHEYDPAAAAAGLTHYWSDDMTGLAGSAASLEGAMVRIDQGIATMGAYMGWRINPLHMGGFEAVQQGTGHRLDAGSPTMLMLLIEGADMAVAA